MLENKTNDYSLFNTTLRDEFNTEFSDKVFPVSIVFGLSACFGFFANILVIYIYGIKYKRCNFKYFLLVLGLIGLGQCTVMLPTQMAEMHYWFNFPTSWLCRVSAYVFGYTVIHCYSILLLIAVDRFRKVCRPYDWQIQPATARNLCIIVSFASLFFAAPPGIVSGHHKFVTTYNDANITVTVCGTDDIFNKRDWAVYFLLLFGGVPVSVIIVVTCTLYGMILKQFHTHGSAVILKSLYNQSPSKLNLEIIDNQKDEQNNIQITNQNVTSSISTAQTTIKHTLSKSELSDIPDSPSQSLKRHKQFNKVFNALFPNRGDSVYSERSETAQSFRKTNSKRAIRDKLLRKTLIMLIITVTCILGLLITFSLHIVAEDVNNNVLSIPSVILNIFVIFHRGSVSIICALFPIIYGIRDHKFRHYVRHMIPRKRSAAHNIQMVERVAAKEESKC
ncbi:uncharacterized protein LOC128238083 [Mya arenaria]|uniref:uncharacterized protein LOC128238083 n=1 Tax=Mya arenaria TaxID=6604 RepID=UPI0022E3AB39|nr:uncharacterized protein LOC128238083 [Mya arenaria]